MAEKIYIEEMGLPIENNSDFFFEQRSLLRADKGFATPDSSVALKDKGQISITNKNNQVKLNRNGHTQEVSLRHEVITNNEDIRANNIFINRHKLNNKLYDYTDFKKGLHSSIDKDEVNQKSGIIGRFCLFGTVLTKAWDQNLKRYVMIRRLTNMPMFSPELDM